MGVTGFMSVSFHKLCALGTFWESVSAWQIQLQQGMFTFLIVDDAELSKVLAYAVIFFLLVLSLHAIWILESFWSSSQLYTFCYPLGFKVCFTFLCGIIMSPIFHCREWLLALIMHCCNPRHLAMLMLQWTMRHIRKHRGPLVHTLMEVIVQGPLTSFNLLDSS
jgi:hypothetical protein